MKLRLLVLLIFIGISAYLWLPAFDGTQNTETSEEPVLVPDFTAQLLHQELFDNNGQLKQEVFSQKMEHFAQLALTYFEQPEFIIYQNEQPFWRIAADVGNLQDGRLTLDQNVVMTQLTDNELVAEITTDYLEINLEKQLVVTYKPITITGDNTVVQGQGLKADLKLQTVTLTHHVRTILKGSKND